MYMYVYMYMYMFEKSWSPGSMLSEKLNTGLRVTNLLPTFRTLSGVSTDEWFWILYSRERRTGRDVGAPIGGPCRGLLSGMRASGSFYFGDFMFIPDLPNFVMLFSMSFLIWEYFYSKFWFKLHRQTDKNRRSTGRRPWEWDFIFLSLFDVVVACSCLIWQI